MKILYTHHQVEGEPGPNLQWRGTPDEYRQLLLDLFPLARSSGVDIDLRDLNYINFDGVTSYKLKSKQQGMILAQVAEGTVFSELDPKAWAEFLHKVLSVSFSAGFIYQDQEDLWPKPLIADANIIMSSSNGRG